MVTMVLPANSSSLASLTAAAAAAPRRCRSEPFLAGQAARHLDRTRRCHRSTRSTIDRSRVSGMKSAPMPWILCGAGLSSCPAWVSTGPSGSTATETLLPGLVFLMKRDTRDGAAGADAADQDVDRAVGVVPDLRDRWSSRGSSGLAGFLNCCGMKYASVGAAISSALATAPFILRRRGSGSGSRRRRR